MNRGVVVSARWVVKSLGEVSSAIQYGFTAKAREERVGPKLLRITDIQSNTVNWSAVPFCEIDEEEKSKYLLRENDLVFARTGATVGKSYLIKGTAPESVFASYLIRVRLKDNVDPRYVAYFFQSAEYWRQIGASQSGIGQPNVNGKKLAQIQIPIAPLDRQMHIVAKIEKQFSRLDEAVANLKRIKANLKRYRAAVLRAAIEGKLTEEWRYQHPDIETGSELLKRILKERRDKWEAAELAKMSTDGKSPKDEKWKSRYKNAKPPRPEDTYSIPNSWTWTNLGQLAWSVKDGPHYSPTYTESGIPFISGGNVRPEGIDFSTAKHISPELHAELSTRCRPECGDLLYTKGGTTGIARINTEAREFNVWVHVAVLKLVDSVERFYIQHALNSPHCYRQSQRYTHGVGNQDLGLTRMVLITLPLPPLKEQSAVVDMIEERLSAVAEIDAQVNLSLKRAERLRHAILRNAFSLGEESKLQ